MAAFVERGCGACGGLGLVNGREDGCDGLDYEWVGVEFRELGLEDGKG